MGRIQPTETGMKIEHWFPQHPDRHGDPPQENEASAPASSAPASQDPGGRAGQESDLSYRNMLAACLGNQGRPHREQHCDTRKGEQLVTVDPRHPSAHPGQITYLSDGTICLDGLQSDLDDRLGLNYETRDSAGNPVDGYLKRNRKERLASYLAELRRRQPEGDWDFRGEFARLESLPEPPPQVGVLLAWLRKKCQRHAGVGQGR
jgi:hypothetical protein